MREIKIPVSSLILFFITIFLGIYTFTLRTDYTDMKKDLEQQKSVIEGKEVNDKFIDAFFEYKSLQSRYKNIEKYMTAQGYQEIVPTNMSNMDPGSIQSSIDELASFVHETSSTELAFYNEFQVSIDYKDNITKQPVLGKTTLIREEEGEWKVHRFELIRVLEENHEDEEID